MISADTPTPRPSERTIVLDHKGRVLMFRAHLADYLSIVDGREMQLTDVWITPGGGLDPGETHEHCAVRELFEETGIGIAVEALGPCVWTRSHTYRWRGVTYDQSERYYLVQLYETPELSFDGWQELEREELAEHRWWTIEDIEASGEMFAPRAITRHLRQLVRGEVPSQPIVVGV